MSSSPVVDFEIGVSVDKDACDLRAAAERVVTLLARQAEHAAVALSVTGAGQCHADGRRLQQVLLNLVVNAIQTQHGGGSVTIAINADGFTVSDQGGGLPAAVVERLFEPFVTMRSEGTGLGLHIAKAIIDTHGADLTYRTRSGGACFMVSGLEAIDAGD